MTYLELQDQTKYFITGYEDAARGWSKTPRGQEGSHSYAEYMRGYSTGESDR